MPFRGHQGQHEESFDPLARFFELEAAFNAGRGLFGDYVPLRLAAAHLVLSPGEPADIAATVRACTDELDPLLPRLTQVAWPMRLLIAAVLVQRGDTPAAFIGEVERVRKLMRTLGMRRYEAYETIAILAMRISNRLQPIRDDQLDRLQAIYEEMKGHHYLLTGPEDYPACAFLAAQNQASPDQIGLRAHLIYEGLRERAKLWLGDPLQTASNILALSSLEPAELVERFYLLVLEFEQRGVKIRQPQYDEVAVLCFLAQPARRIVDTVVDNAREIGDRLRWVDRATSLGLASNLAFVRLTGNDPELGILADAKTLLDMQTVIVTRAAAAG